MFFYITYYCCHVASPLLSPFCSLFLTFPSLSRPKPAIYHSKSLPSRPNSLCYSIKSHTLRNPSSFTDTASPFHRVTHTSNSKPPQITHLSFGCFRNIKMSAPLPTTPVTKMPANTSGTR